MGYFFSDCGVSLPWSVTSKTCTTSSICSVARTVRLAAVDGKYVERRASNPDVLSGSEDTLNTICTAFAEVRATRGMKADTVSGASVTPMVTGPPLSV